MPVIYADKLTSHRNQKSIFLHLFTSLFLKNISSLFGVSARWAQINFRILCVSHEIHVYHFLKLFFFICQQHSSILRLLLTPKMSCSLHNVLGPSHSVTFCPWRCATFWGENAQYTSTWHVILCFVTLCHVVPHVVLCCATLCHVILYLRLR